MPVSDLHEEALGLRFEEVSKVAQKISIAPNLAEALQVIADGARCLTGAHSCIICLQPPNRDVKFEIASSSPREQHPRIPLFAGTLMEKVLAEESNVVISDARKEEIGEGVEARQEVLNTGILSVAGVPINNGGHRAIGALYVDSKTSRKFTTTDVRVLRWLANLVPMAQGLSAPLVRLTDEVEAAAGKLFEVEGTARNVCEAVQEKFGFDFVALQLVDQKERSISTIYATGVLNTLIGLAKHPLDRSCHCDIQADIVIANPPKIEIITGWDDRFDKWIFERYNHRNMTRVWAPIIVLRDENEEVITDWFTSSAWETGGNRNSGRCAIYLNSSDLRRSSVSIDVIGTIEAGYETPTEISPDKAIDLANCVSKAAVFPISECKDSNARIKALPLREVLLSYVLESITKNAMKIVGGDVARLFFGRRAGNRYSYEVYVADSSPWEQRTLKPREGGLGERALKAGTPLVNPDALRGEQSDNLQSSHQEAWKLGIRAMAAFPISVEAKEGISEGLLYVGLKKRHWFREYEIRSVERFVGRAVDAIRKALLFRERMDAARRLENFYRAAQSLVDDPTKGGALEWIVGSARNILSADLVMICEYNVETTKCEDFWFAGKLINEAAIDDYKRLETQFCKSRLSYSKGCDIVIETFSGGGILDNVNRPLSEVERTFISHEEIRCRIALTLQVATEGATEPVGCMVVHYRDSRQLSENDKKALQIVSYAASDAIRSKRNVQKIRFNLFLREKELEAFRDVDKQIISTKGNVQRIQQLVLDKALAITGAETGVFMEYDKWSQKLKPLATRGYGGINVGEQGVDVGIIGLAARKREPQVVSDVSSSEWKKIYVPTVCKTRSELAFPILDKEKGEEDSVVAVLNLEHSNPGFFRREHADLLGMLAEQALIGMHYGELLERNKRSIRALETLGG